MRDARPRDGRSDGVRSFRRPFRASFPFRARAWAAPSRPCDSDSTLGRRGVPSPPLPPPFFPMPTALAGTGAPGAPPPFSLPSPAPLPCRLRFRAASAPLPLPPVRVFRRARFRLAARPAGHAPGGRHRWPARAMGTRASARHRRRDRKSTIRRAPASTAAAAATSPQGTRRSRGLPSPLAARGAHRLGGPRRPAIGRSEALSDEGRESNAHGAHRGAPNGCRAARSEPAGRVSEARKQAAGTACGRVRDAMRGAEDGGRGGGGRRGGGRGGGGRRAARRRAGRRRVGAERAGTQQSRRRAADASHRRRRPVPDLSPKRAERPHAPPSHICGAKRSLRSIFAFAPPASPLPLGAKLGGADYSWRRSRSGCVEKVKSVPRTGRTKSRESQRKGRVSVEGGLGRRTGG